MISVKCLSIYNFISRRKIGYISNYHNILVIGTYYMYILLLSHDFLYTFNNNLKL